MLCLVYLALIAFEITASVLMVRKNSLNVLRPLTSEFLNGTGIALVLMPLIFGEAFMAFDEILIDSSFMPVLMLLSILALILFTVTSRKCDK